MSGMQDRDILFVDEAHTLVLGNKNKADWLLPFMTEGVLYTKRGPQQMPNIAIVAATTDAGKLPDTLLSRFMCEPTIVHYSAEEAALIALNLAERMEVPIAPEDGAAISAAADRNPRAMRKILTAVRDLSYAYPESHPNLERAFRFAGVSPDGLTTVARDMLLVLLQSREFTASIEAIHAHLGEPGPLKHHEKILLQHGYIDVGSRGRSLTERGQDRALTEARLRIRETA
jgi:Holliday junction resolvasome RuvABC ATP-dependent DNA helicase subunit